MAKLIIRTPDGQEREFPLADRPLRIGRGEHNDVVLPDPDKAVSRFHAELRFEDGAYRLVDANTPNGLWVAGERVPEVVLQPGVAVVVGPYTLSLGDASQPPKTVAVPVLPATMLSTAPRNSPPPPPEPTPPPRRADGPKSVATTSVKPPVAKMTSRPQFSPTVIGAALVALALIAATVVGVVVVRHRRPQQQVAQNTIAPPTPPKIETPPPPPEPSTEEKVRDHLEQAQRLFDAKDYDGATNELAQVAELDASNGDAAQLRAKIEDARRPPPPPPPPSGVPKNVGKGTAVQQASSPNVGDKPKLQDRYREAEQTVKDGKYQEAISKLDALQRDDPTNKDVASLMDLAKAKLGELIQNRLALAKQSESSGDLSKAKSAYEELQRLGASDAAAEGLKNVRAKMDAEGTAAFRQAVGRYAYKQYDEALPLFRRAYEYLSDQDPNRKTAKDRIDELQKRK